MNIQQKLTIILVGLPHCSVGTAQRPCAEGVHIEGIVEDSTGAAIPGAQIQTSFGQTVVADGSGRYVLRCISVGHASITLQAPGFSAKTLTITTHAGQVAHADLHWPSRWWKQMYR